MEIEFLLEANAWSALGDRFRILSPKGAGGAVVGRGPNATAEDEELANQPMHFTSVDDAAAWIEDQT